MARMRRRQARRGMSKSKIPGQGSEVGVGLALLGTPVLVVQVQDSVRSVFTADVDACLARFLAART